jgi:hypothetical protein
VACIAAAQISSFLFCFFIVQCVATIVINFSEQRAEAPADCASGVPELHQVIAGAAPLALLVV